MSIDEIDCLGIPVPTHLGCLKAGDDPVAAYSEDGGRRTISLGDENTGMGI